MAPFDFWYFLAGLALFVYAIQSLEESLRSLAGRPFKKFLQQQTSNPLKAIMGGALVTAVLQSSSVVLLMTLSFVGAGIMSLRNALAVVLGSNFGTTLDSWIIAWLGFRFEIDALAYPVLAASLAGMLVFGRNRTVRLWTRFAVAFALVFIGLSFMKTSLSSDAALSLLTGFSRFSPFLFIVLGFIITGIIQSSFAMMAILLSALHVHALPFEHAAAAVVGSELGTALKLLLGASGGTSDKRRFAWGNFFFNVLTLVLGSILLFPLVRLVHGRLFPQDALTALVFFQSLLNLAVVVLCYPYLRKIASVLEQRIPSQPNTVDHAESLADGTLLAEELLVRLRTETRRLFFQTILLNRKVLGIGQAEQLRGIGLLGRMKQLLRAVPFIDEYRQLKQQQGELLEACADLLREELTPEETEQLNRLVAALRNCIHAAKSLKDIRHNLRELADTANDRLYGLLQEMKDREADFYRSLESGLSDRPAGSDFPLEQALEHNKHQLEKVSAQALQLLQEHSIKEYEASTLMNVYREIYSSHKALLKAAGW